MKLKEIREAYYGYSGSASSVSRQAAFAGIAVIWVFKHQENGAFAIPSELAFPLLMFMSSLAADLFHYIAGSIIWGKLNRDKEKKYGPDFEGDIHVTSKTNWATTFFFVVKLALVSFGYIFLIKFGIGEIDIK